MKGYGGQYGWQIRETRLIPSKTEVFGNCSHMRSLLNGRNRKTVLQVYQELSDSGVHAGKVGFSICRALEIHLPDFRQ
jgi:hypothetical protein